MPTSKDKCIFNYAIREKIYSLYRESDLEAMEYANSVLPIKDERMEEYLTKYKEEPVELDDQDTDRVNIFWESMDYLGMTDYIRQRESEI